MEEENIIDLDNEMEGEGSGTLQPLVVAASSQNHHHNNPLKRERDLADEMRERIKNLGAGGSKKSMVTKVVGLAGNLDGLVLDVKFMGGLSKYVKVTIMVLGKSQEEGSEHFAIPKAPRPNQLERALMEQYPPMAGQEVAHRLPMLFVRGDVISICCFENKIANFQVGTYVTVSGLVYEVGFKKLGPSTKDEKYLDLAACQNGDACVEFRCESFTLGGAPPLETLYKLLKMVPMDRIENLSPGIRTPYDEDTIRRVTVKNIGKDKQQRDGVVIPWEIPTIDLWKKGDDLPVVVFHLDNTLLGRLLLEDHPLPPRYNDRSMLPYFTGDSLLDPSFLRYTTKEGVDKMVVKGDTSLNKKGNYRCTSVLGNPEVILFGTLRDQGRGNGTGGIMDLGICTPTQWSICGMQLMRCIDCVICMAVDPLESVCTSADNSAFMLQAKWGYSLLAVDYDNMFTYAGIKIDAQLAKEVLKAVKLKEESVLQKKLSNEPESVRCICLNEFKGDIMEEFSDNKKWQIYCVPGEHALGGGEELVKNTGAYLIHQNHWEKNEWPLEERVEFVRKNWMLGALMANLTIFAIRV
jgi:hypothetical protein